MSKIFCVTNTKSLGCTFLDWSIHWLSGEDKFYNTQSGWDELSSNPLTEINAHNHQKNCTSGYFEFISTIDKLKSIQTDNTLSIYSCSAEIDSVIEILGISKNNVSKFLSEINEYIADDVKKTWEYCNLNKIPLIYLKLSYPAIYNSEIRDIEGTYNTVEVRADFLNLYFNNADIWVASTLWEKREWIALNIRPFDQPNNHKNIDFSISHLYVDAQEFWFSGEAVLEKIMSYLDIEIDTNRWVSWISIYQRWQKLQIKVLRFAWNIDYICDAIVNNHYYDISDYNLDLWHEAIIQHVLLYKYNLNLKSWQLEKFPSNTQDLHKLLESNIIHKLDDIYGLLGDR